MSVNKDRYETAGFAYLIARDWDMEASVFGHEEEAAIDYNIAMCLSKHGRYKEARVEIETIDLAVDLSYYAKGDGIWSDSRDTTKLLISAGVSKEF
ncbi:kinesin light chain 1 [Colletotrichum tofieldiae]|nr:kinesin light chain 1 [Colletotrichum tofieldiae]